MGLSCEFSALSEELMPAWQQSLSRLVAVKSVYDEQTRSCTEPFGAGVGAAFSVLGDIGRELGFAVYEHDGYALDLRWPPEAAPAGDYVGILGHVDVVDIYQPQEWLSDPFVLSRRGDFLYARGVNDDKGPLLLALYAAYMVRAAGYRFKRPLRIIAGGDEERNWQCIEHYLQREAAPVLAFSPDGNFPLVNHELGILDLCLHFPADSAVGELRLHSPEARHMLCSELELMWGDQRQKISGRRALSRHPERGLAALDILTDAAFAEGAEPYSLVWSQTSTGRFYRQYLHSAAKECLAPYDPPEHYTQCVTAVDLTADGCSLYLDLRYPHELKIEQLWQRILAVAAEYGAVPEILRSKAPLYVDPEDELLHRLAQAYTSVSGRPAELLTKGGASYARALPKAIAFGPSFPEDRPASHESNECLHIEQARQALVIYAEAVKLLCCS